MMGEGGNGRTVLGLDAAWVCGDLLRGKQVRR